MKSFGSIPFGLATVAILATQSCAHSWVEELDVIKSDGTYTGSPGYARGWVPRDTPGYTDTLVQWQLPQPSKGKLDGSDTMCRPSQQNANQTNGSPALKAAPGSFIALRYRENGHVSMPQVPPGKPAHSGTVYIYGTSDPKPDDKFEKIFQVWNKDGSGGDKRGKLLATQTFDDGQCYENPDGSPINNQRRKDYPTNDNSLMCQNDIALPKDVPVGKPYTIYWVWDWSTMASAAAPGGVKQLYTTCMDIEITGGNKRSIEENGSEDLAKRDVSNSGVPSLMNKLRSGNDDSASPSGASSTAAGSQAASSSAAASQPATSAPAASTAVASQPTSTLPVGTPVPPNPTPPAGATTSVSIPGMPSLPGQTDSTATPSTTSAAAGAGSSTTSSILTTTIKSTTETTMTSTSTTSAGGASTAEPSPSSTSTASLNMHPTTPAAGAATSASSPPKASPTTRAAASAGTPEGKAPGSASKATPSAAAGTSDAAQCPSQATVTVTATVTMAPIGTALPTAKSTNLTAPAVRMRSAKFRV
ncbi:MAG: hypothetical protein M4579_002036 [Chaenotheca gracillima]|nr:MAG: hypothetical protein M4579_002036 [Chaenotheca gracillima]